MWGLFAIVFVAGVIVLIQVPPMVSKKYYRDLFAFSIVLVVALTFSVLKILKLPVINPLHTIQYVFRPISTWLFSLLE